MNSPRLRIAIIGAGIAGLTLALALRQRGVAAEVFEQASELTEIGAAVGLAANATRELRRLGVLDAIAAFSTEPTELIYRDWCDGRRMRATRSASNSPTAALCRLTWRSGRMESTR
jgi:salicylate hydroxylase